MEAEVLTPPQRDTVVIVDDDPLIASTLLRSLRLFQVDVVKATSAFGALNMIAERRPVLVIFDVMMPGLTGTDLATLVRQDPELKHTKVLLHSALDEDVLARKAAECGADGYLLKTAGPSAIERKLMRWLRAPPLQAATGATHVLPRPISRYPARR